MCLSAEGKILVLASHEAAIVQQYNEARQTWERVGEFQSDDKTDFGITIACTADVRTIALGRMTRSLIQTSGLVEVAGKVTIWAAVESSDSE